MKRKILFVVPYPVGESPSQRFRFEQYLTLLEQEYMITIAPFWSVHAWRVLYEKNHALIRFLFLIGSLVKRGMLLFSVIQYNFIFIHREAAPIGPPWWEWITAKILRKKIIYDFDDAIWSTDNADEPRLISWVRWRSKVRSICRWSYKASVGNAYLATYAKNFCKRVVINPTTIDTQTLHNKELYPAPDKNSNQVVIGWTGSHSTLKYLHTLEKVLQSIALQFPFVYTLVIADKMPDLNIPNLIFKKWSKATEVTDLLLADIGIMPLPDDEWTKGKCGFKALQYMALEIPALVTPVGVNTEIVEHGVDGFVCSTEQMWQVYITELIIDKSKAKHMGMMGRKTVQARYSVTSNTDCFLSLFS
jgi:glycosyltransferase involved in cell wall biosynthesis